MRARTICGEMRSRRARILTAGNVGLAGVHTTLSTVHIEARLALGWRHSVEAREEKLARDVAIFDSCSSD